MHKSMKDAVLKSQIAMPSRLIEDDAMVFENTILFLNATKAVLLMIGWTLVPILAVLLLGSQSYFLPLFMGGAALHWSIEAYHRRRRSAQGPWNHLDFMVVPKSLYFLYKDLARLAPESTIAKPLSKVIKDCGMPMVHCPQCGVVHVFYALSEKPHSTGERTCGFDGCTASIKREVAYHD